MAGEVSALDGLRRASDELWQCHELKSGLERMVEAGIDLLRADMGNIQLLNAKRRVLEIVAARGFGEDFLEHFREVAAGTTAACGRSLRSGKRVIIEDVQRDPAFSPHRAVAAAAGYRAVQSTPLFDSVGKPLGVFSTHFREPHRPSEPDLVRFDLYARQAAQFIERMERETRLKRLTRGLLAAQGRAEREIARELHDIFSQDLAAIGIELASWKSDGRTEVDHLARASVLSQKIAELALRLHETSRKLHPSVVDDVGLVAALKQECSDFQRSHTILIEFTAENVPARFRPEAALCLYRVVQECLRNIDKHATGTDKIWVSLKCSSEGITPPSRTGETGLISTRR